MTITTDQPATNRDDRPTEPTEPLHLDPPERSRPETKPLRTALGWVLGTVAIAAAAVLVAVVVDADGTGMSVNRGVVTERGDTGNGPTEIDVHGIPTWWSGEQPAPERIAAVENRPTELDVHGIPTWWSGEEAAALGSSKRLEPAES